MPNLLKRDIWSFVSPIDPRTIFLFIACAIAFFMGARFESVDTLKVEREFAEYKLKQTEALNKAQQAALDEAVAAYSAIQEINENAKVREAQLLSDNHSLAARVRDERLRREALAKQMPKASAASASCERVAEGPGGELYGQAGEDIVSLIWEADVIRSGLLDCQAYIKRIQNGGSSSEEP